MNGNTIIQAQKLNKQFPGNTFKSVDSISLNIPANSKFGVFGPNGAGKTTLISMLCGLTTPDSGNVVYTFDRCFHPSEVRGKIGYVPQDFAFYPELSPMENLRYFGAIYHMDSLQIQEQSEKLLHILGLTDVKNKAIKSFSGGMKRRINLAIGLLHQPEILFLDEPTVGVDVQSRHAIMDFLESEFLAGKTIVYTSHHLAEAEAFCDEIILLDQGQIVAEGSTVQLLRDSNSLSLENLFLAITGKSYRDA